MNTGIAQPVKNGQPQVEFGQSNFDESSPIFKLLANGIRSCHAAARRSELTAIIEACKAGVLLQTVLRILPKKVGEWCARQDFEFSKMTRSKYQRLASRFQIEADKGKLSLPFQLKLGPDQIPASYEFDEETFSETVRLIANGRGLTDLYIEWEIIKPCTSNSTEKRSSCEPKPVQSPSEAKFTAAIRLLDEIAALANLLNRAQRDTMIVQVGALLKLLEAGDADARGQRQSMPNTV